MKGLGGGQAAEGIVVSFLVVFEHPSPGELPDLSQAGKEPSVEHLGTVGPIEALDEGVLVRFAGLDVVDEDAVPGTPFGEPRSFWQKARKRPTTTPCSVRT